MGIKELLNRRAAPPEPLDFASALGKIKETAQEAFSCGYAPEMLHCRGCVNTCPLSRPRCDMGRNVLAALQGDHEED